MYLRVLLCFQVRFVSPQPVGLALNLPPRVFLFHNIGPTEGVLRDKDQVLCSSSLIGGRTRVAVAASTLLVVGVGNFTCDLSISSMAMKRFSACSAVTLAFWHQAFVQYYCGEACDVHLAFPGKRQHYARAKFSTFHPSARAGFLLTSVEKLPHADMPHMSTITQ